MQHAHDAGIVHRDIKPSNLIVDQKGRVWITDFGLARLADSGDSLTRSGEMIGTLHYMSPEQAVGEHGLVDHRSDIYSLGATLYELATLERVVRGRSTQEVLRELAFDEPRPPRTLNPSIPADLETVICKCLRKNPLDRYQSARDLAEDLRRVMRGERPLVKPPTWRERVQWWVTRHPTVAVAAGVAVIAVALMSSALAVLSNQAMVTQRQLRFRSEGGRLLAQAALYQQEDPPLALGLAKIGAGLSVGEGEDQVLIAAADHNHMLAVLERSLPAGARAAYSRDGARLVTFGSGSNSGEVVVWDARRRSVVQHLTWPMEVRSAALDGTGTYLAVQLEGSAAPQLRRPARVEVWEVGATKPSMELSGYAMADLDPSPFLSGPDAWLGLIDPDGQAVVLTRERQPLSILQVTGRVVDIAPIDPAGEQFVVAMQDGRILKVGRHSGVLARWQVDSAGVHARMQIGTDARTLVVQRRTESGAPVGVWCVQLDQPEASPLVYQRAIGTLSPDGERLALHSLYRKGSIIELRDARSGRLLGETRIPSTAAVMAMVDRGRTLAVATANEIRLFDAKDCQPIGVCRGASDYLTAIAPRPESDQFVTLGTSGQAIVWSAVSDRQRRTLPLALRSIGAYVCSFSEDGQRALIGPIASETSYLVRTDSDRPTRLLRGGIQARMSDYRLIAVIDGGLQVWSADASNLLYETEFDTEQVAQVEPIHGADAALIRTMDRELWMWPFGALPQRVDLNDRRVVAASGAARSPHVILLDSNRDLFLMDGTTGERKRLRVDGEQIVDATLSADASRAAIVEIGSDQQSAVTLLDTATGDEVWRSDRRADLIADVFVGYLGERVAVIRYDSSHNLAIELWDVARNKVIATLKGQQPWSIRPSDSDRYLFLGLADRSVVVDLEDGHQVPIAEGRPVQGDFLGDRLLAVAYGSGTGERLDSPLSLELVTWSPDDRDSVGRRNLEMSADQIRLHTCPNGVIITEVGSAVCECEFGSGNAQVRGCYSFGPSGLRLAAYVEEDRSVLTVGTRGGIRKYGRDASTCEFVPYPVGRIDAAALTPDGALLAVAGEAGLALIDVAEGRVVKSLDANRERTMQLVFDAAGNRLLVFGTNPDGTPLLQLWDVRSERVVAFDVADTRLEMVDLASNGQHVLAVPQVPVVQQPISAVGPGQVLVFSGDGSSLEGLSTEAIVRQAVFSGDGNHVVVCERTGGVIVYDLSNRSVLHRWYGRKPVRAVSAQTGAPHLVAGLAEEEWTVWSLESGQVAYKVSDLMLRGLVDEPNPPLWHFGARRAAWWCVPNGGRLVIYPRNPRKYVEQMQPRSLTEAEKQHFRITSDLLR